MNPISFSIVVPLFNKEREIERALRSVRNQSYPHYEVIVVDDGSTNNSARVVEKLNYPNVRLIRQTNGGVSAARNRGIREASHDFVAFLDADDEWLPSFLETISELINKYPGAGAYATGYIRIYADGQEERMRFAVPPEPWDGAVDNYFTSVIFGDPIVCSSAVCVPKAVFRSVGGFAVGVKLGEDLDQWGRIALKYPIVFSPTVKAIYHQDADQRATQVHTLERPWVFEAIAAETLSKRELDPQTRFYLGEYVAKVNLKFVAASFFEDLSRRGFARVLLKGIKTSLFQRKVFIYKVLILLPKEINLALIRCLHFIR